MIHNSRLQSGNTLLVVTAAIAFSLISALIVLGIDTLTVKVRSTRLFLATSDIARRLSPLALTQSDLVGHFKTEISTLQSNGQLGGGVEITEAILISPVMPEDFVYSQANQLWAAAPRSFSSRNAYEGELLNNLASDFFDKGDSFRPPSPFCRAGSSEPTDPACKRISFTQATSGAQRCYLYDVATSQHSKDCLFQGYSSSLVMDSNNNSLVVANESAPIPLGVISNLQNAGNSVGVYIAARTSTWLSGSREVSATSLARMLPRGINSSARVPGIPASLPTPSGSFHTAATTPGLFVAIAPQLEIPNVASGANKHFTYALFPKALDLGLDPLSAIGTTLSITTPFGASATDQLTGGDNLSDSDFVVKAPPLSGDIAEVKAFAAACSNPVSQMRNAFVSTLLDMAARDGNLRAGIEMLLVNSLANFPLKASEMTPPRCDPTATSFGSCAWPTVIVHKGEDSAKNLFQIPYTTMNFGQNSGAPVSGGFTYAVEPAVADSRPLDVKARQLRFSSQLRSCYNLYSPRFGLGVSPAVLRRYTIGLDETVYNPYLPANVFPPPSLQKYTTNTAFFNPMAADSWDQQCAYGENSNCTKTYSLAGLTAAQVAGAMGTVQLCALRTLGDPICPRLGQYNPQDPLYKSRIRPDFVALFRYINAGFGASPTLSAAIEPPGMWPIESVQTSGTGLDNIFTFSDFKLGGTYRYIRPAPISSLMNLVLVTHLPPSDDPAELSALAQQISYFNHAGFGALSPLMLRVIVAYFPASSYDAQTSVISRWETVLSIAANSGVQRASFNQLLVFSPYNSKFIGSGYTWADGSGDDENRFGLYWRDHLLAASGDTYGHKDLIESYSDSDVPVRRAQETYYEILNEVGDLL